MGFLTLSLLVRQPHLESNLTVNDESMVNPDKLFFYGNSQGAVLGGGYTAMHGQMDGVILGVGGAPFSLAQPCTRLHPISLDLETMYDNWMDITLIQALYQQLWDPTESIGWTHLQQSPVLMQAQSETPVFRPSVPMYWHGVSMQGFAACKQNGFRSRASQSALLRFSLY